MIRIEELKHTQGIGENGSEESQKDIPPGKNPEKNQTLQKSRRHQRIAQTQKIATEPLKSKSIDEIQVTGMHILDVVIEDFSTGQTFRHVGKDTGILRPPETIIKTTDQPTIKSRGQNQT